ncbi:MAG: hypothetical protein JST96_01645 [Bacteroidetes bacterium]|nr:hypothetical protein [Bacteroidota bacterium]
MKKLLSGIFSLLYFAVASGVAVNIHYCMGHVSTVDYVYNKNNSGTCGKCGMENKKGCCHNESKFIKLTDDQQLVKADFSADQFVAILPSSFLDFSTSLTGIEKSIALQYHSPPDKRMTFVYLHNCVFRI